MTYPQVDPSSPMTALQYEKRAARRWRQAAALKPRGPKYARLHRQAASLAVEAGEKAQDLRAVERIVAARNG